jgi:hypothetical protein
MHLLAPLLLHTHAEGQDPRAVVQDVMVRPLKAELDLEVSKAAHTHHQKALLE